MLISEAIKELEEFKAKNGDRPIHLEVGEDKDCDKCGQSNYERMCGMLKRVESINIHGVGICVWLLANNE